MHWDASPLRHEDGGRAIENHGPEDEERSHKVEDSELEERVWIWNQPEGTLPRLKTPGCRKRGRRRQNQTLERPKSHEDLTTESSPSRTHLKRSNSTGGCITLLPPIAPTRSFSQQNEQTRSNYGSSHSGDTTERTMKQHEQSLSQVHLWGACLEEAIATFEAQEIVLTAELDSDERCRVSLQQHIKLQETISPATAPSSKTKAAGQCRQAAYMQSRRSYEHVKQKLIALDRAIAQNKEKLVLVQKRIKELTTSIIEESSEPVVIQIVPIQQVTDGSDVVPAPVETKRRKTNKAKSSHGADAIAVKDRAAARIQKVFRVFVARQRLFQLVRQVYKRVLDPESQQYFYFNTKTQQSQWDQPKLLQNAQHNNCGLSLDAAATRIQALYRRRAARVALRTLLSGLYEKIYDPESDSYFYYCKKTNTSQWDKPKLLHQDDLVPSGTSSSTATIQKQSAATRIQKLYRSRATRLFLMDLARGNLEKIFDPDFQTWYFFNHRTQQTFWETAQHAQLLHE